MSESAATNVGRSGATPNEPGPSVEASSAATTEPRTITAWMFVAVDEIERLRAKLAEYDKYVAEFTRHA